MDYGLGGIRVVRFPGELCGHHECAIGVRYSMAADVADIVCFAKHRCSI
jgi:hypothetical protein